MKYIIIDQEVNGVTIKTPVIFPNRLVHKDVASAMLKVLRHMNPDATDEVTGAGDVFLIGSKTSGKSETLNLEATQDDQDVIDLCDYIHAWPLNDEEDGSQNT